MISISVSRTHRAIAAALLLLPALAGHGAEPVRPLDLARQLNEAFVAVVESVSPAVVVIDVAQREVTEEFNASNPWLELLPEGWREQLRREQEQRRQQRRQNPPDGPRFDGQGSGMIVSPEGDVLTNHHVVEGAEKLRIRLRDGRKFDVEVRGSDPDSDLAVLRIKNPPADLPAITFGDSDKVRVGEFAIAIGAPYRLDYSVSVGHISAKGRSDLMGGMFDQAFLQTDANINPGNSGGPLVDIEGRVIGVNSMIRGLNSGIGFAIPSNLAREITSRLVEDGRFVRAWLGISIGALREDENVRRTVPDLEDGVVVTGIAPDGPSSRARPRLQPSDVITAVDGRAVAGPNELRAIVSRKRPGSTVVLDVRRAGDSLEVQVEPGALPPAEERMIQFSRRSRDRDVRETHGIEVEALPAAQESNGSPPGGVRVSAVLPGSVAAGEGVQPGDVLSEINHQPVDSPQQARRILEASDLSRGILLRLEREGQETFRVLRPQAE